MAPMVWVLGFNGSVHKIKDEETAYILADEYPEWIYFYADLDSPDMTGWPFKDESCVTIAEGIFTNGVAISYKGENYYKACGAWVRVLPDDGRSSCVKRVNHPSDMHEDWDGVERRV